MPPFTLFLLSTPPNKGEFQDPTFIRFRSVKGEALPVACVWHSRALSQVPERTGPIEQETIRGLRTEQLSRQVRIRCLRQRRRSLGGVILAKLLR
eukprot:m.110222 g.110222  ORF g.110222 m.110222 type:complete len:95 (-) comp51795_c0_seq15:99-383(-)